MPISKKTGRHWSTNTCLNKTGYTRRELDKLMFAKKLNEPFDDGHIPTREDVPFVGATIFDVFACKRAYELGGCDSCEDFVNHHCPSLLFGHERKHPVEDDSFAIL